MQSEVIQRIEVGTGVRVHRHAIAGVGQQFFGSVAAGYVRHEDLKRGIAEWSAANRHPDEQLDTQIVDFAAGDLLDHVEPGRIGHHVERTDLVGGTPRTFCCDILGDLRVRRAGHDSEHRDAD